MATISDICKATGFSKATVSRVINGNPSVKPKTRDIVLQTMESLGYQPNPVAQSLATRRSNTIGLILPHFFSYYFGTITQTIAQSVQDANKKLLVVDSHNTKEGELEALRSLVSQKCASIVVYSRHLSEQELIEFRQSSGVPMIVLNRLFSTPELSSFGFSQFQLGYLATEYLLNLGHSEIACITNPLNSQTGVSRLEAYRKCLEDHNIPFKETLVDEGSNIMNSGYDAVLRLLERKQTFSAIFCSTDDMAIGAIRALHERGLTVPKDVSIVGIDDEPNSTFSIPSISTVSLPIKKLTTEAIELAIHFTESPDSGKYMHKEYLGSLVSRESAKEKLLEH
ncbi:LacI family transcriptional regulator [Vibrio sp.]|nr:LacI family transcriptional regulator [Vibrio sp.]